MALFQELKRRNVFRVGIAYLVGAWLVLQLAEVLSELLDLPDQMGPVVVALVVIGFPIVMFAAWAYELTPQGIRRESDVSAETSITRQTGKRLNTLITAMLVGALGYFVWEARFMETQTDREGDEAAAGEVSAASSEAGPEPSVALPGQASASSIAVLPFANLSADPENEYFSDGLTDTLLNMLAELEGLQVAARTSSFWFKGRNPTIAEVAETLNVSHVLEGGVQRAEGQIRVTAQLIRAEDGFNVWSRNYTRPLEGIFAVQDEIASDVAEALGASLLNSVGSRPVGLATENLSAYDAYLRGREREVQHNVAGLEAAEAFYQEALALDEGFTDARLALARVQWRKQDLVLIDYPTMETRARSLLDPVLERQPHNSRAKAIECILELTSPRFMADRNSAVSLIQRCHDLLAQVPTESLLRLWLAIRTETILGDPQGAIDLLEAGLLIDPLEPQLLAGLGNLYARMGAYVKAEQLLNKAIGLSPENPVTPRYLSGLMKRQGRWAEALYWTRRGFEINSRDPGPVAELSWQLYLSGLVEEGDRLLQRLQSIAPGSVLDQSVQMGRAWLLEDDDRALELSFHMLDSSAAIPATIVGDIVDVYCDLMMRSDRAREGFDFLLSRAPGVDDFSTLPEERWQRAFQWGMLALMANFATPEERLAAWEARRRALRNAGWLSPESHTEALRDHAMRGEYDEAAAILLEILEDSGEPRLEDHRRLLPDLYGPVYDEPRVKARFEERRRWLERERAKIVEMLASEEWQS